MATRPSTEAQAIAQEIYSESSTQLMPLGTKCVTSDGRAFRYVKVGGTALVAGKLYDGAATVDNHQNLTCAAASIGDTSVTVTLGGTAATANQYAGGVLIINDQTGQGYTYAIKSHPAQATTTGDLAVALEDPIIEALDTTSQASLTYNQYNGVIIHAATETGVAVGVAVYDVTEAYYGWLQTRGPVSLLQDASTGSAGQAVAASTTTDGSGTVGTGVLAPIGTYIDDGTSTEYNPVFLTID